MDGVVLQKFIEGMWDDIANGQDFEADQNSIQALIMRVNAKVVAEFPVKKRSSSKPNTCAYVFDSRSKNNGQKCGKPCDNECCKKHEGILAKRKEKEAKKAEKKTEKDSKKAEKSEKTEKIPEVKVEKAENSEKEEKTEMSEEKTEEDKEETVVEGKEAVAEVAEEDKTEKNENTEDSGCEYSNKNGKRCGKKCDGKYCKPHGEMMEKRVKKEAGKAEKKSKKGKKEETSE
jgi:hypothetical protein